MPRLGVRPAPLPTVRIDHALAVYLLDATARNYSPKTLLHYRTRLVPFATWAAESGAADLAALTPDAIRRWLAAEAKRGLAPTTVHTAARAIRAFLNFCVREGLLATSPMTTVAMPRKPKLQRPVLTPVQTRSLLAADHSPRDRALLLLLLDTGLRAAEVCALTVSDVDLSDGRVRVRQGKGAKDRTVWMGAKATRSLLRLLVERPLAPATILFVSAKQHRRLTPSTLLPLIRRAGERAGLHGLGPHTLRRTYAVSALRSGIDLYSLARLMGHEDIATLRAYLPLADSDLSLTARSHSPADRA